MFSFHDAKVQHIISLNSRNVTYRNELASYCELFIHRPLFCPQIITDFIFRHGKTTAFSKTRLWLRITLIF